MPLSDLTGTKWVLNSADNISVPSVDVDYSINFSSAGDDYTAFGLHTLDGKRNIVYNYSTVLYGGYWNDEQYRIISITGGTDATNATLISWLQANATQVEVTDLSGTEWEFNSSVTVDEETYSINFTSNSNNYTELQSYAMYGGTITFGQDFVYYGNSGGWTNEAYKSISITSGTDTTNPNLIVWLTQNATYQVPVVGTTYELTHSLTNLTHGNVSFTITPDTGYALPSSVTVTNGTLVSYDSTTGVVVVSGDSAEISVTCEAAIVVDPVLANNDWATIRAVCEAGDAGDYWALGDEKNVTAGGYTRPVKLVHLGSIYSTKKAVFQFWYRTEANIVWDANNSNDVTTADIWAALASGGTAYTELIDANLGPQLTDTTVQVAKNGNDGTITTLTGKLFLPAEKEITASPSYSRSEERAVLTTFGYYAANDNAATRVKHKASAPTATSSQMWWLRSPCSGSSIYIVVVYSSGDLNGNNADNTSRGVAPCFSF